MALTDAILLGAGTGTRYAQSRGEQSNQLPKQFHLLEGKPVFIWALQSLFENLEVRCCVLVISKEYLAQTEQNVVQFCASHLKSKIKIIAGGSRRQDSSLNGLLALQTLNPPPEKVLIHDACRPFIGRRVLETIQDLVVSSDVPGWVPVIPVTETLKRVENNQIVQTINRSQVFRVQTPQVFDFKTLTECMQAMQTQPELAFTDDASILEHFGKKVRTFPGDERNIKLTYEFESSLLKHYLTPEIRTPKCGSESATTFTV